MLPDWNDYTSIQNWFWKVVGEYYHSRGYFPTTANLPRVVWEKVRKNHFISVGGHLFFGLTVKIHDNDDNAWVTNSRHDK